MFNYEDNSITKYNGGAQASIAIPNKTAQGKAIRTIKNKVFANIGLHIVQLPNSLIRIEYGAFKNALIRSLHRNDSFDSIEHIGQQAFKNNFLSYLKVPKNIKVIEPETFANNQITTLSLPKGLKQIQTKAFSNNAINKLILPKGLKSIENCAFKDNMINKIIIGDNVDIGQNSMGRYHDQFMKTYNTNDCLGGVHKKQGDERIKTD